MFSQATIIMALVGVGLLLLYFANTLNKENHFLLVLLTLFVVLGVFILIPKAILDNQNDCEIVIQNATVIDNTTTYDYSEFCTTNTAQTPLIFYRLMLWFSRVFIAYVFLYILYILFDRYTGLFKK